MEQYNKAVKHLLNQLEDSKAILVGAASGLSAAAGYRHYYERDDYFVEHFGEYEKKYGFHNSFDGFYYRYKSIEEEWGFYAKFVGDIMDEPIGQPYIDLMRLLEGKNYHILTTNQDLQFVKIGVEESKLSQIQGEWRFLQCDRRCHDGLYDAVEPIKKLRDHIDENLSVPNELIPRCPKCGGLMTQWVRGFHFLEGQRYREEYRKTNEFIRKNRNKKILFLELGVGRMTPMFIQEPFWQLTYALPQAHYITINPRDAILPEYIMHKGYAMKYDIAQMFHDAVTLL